jgi:hypothetical protein
VDVISSIVQIEAIEANKSGNPYIGGDGSPVLKITTAGAVVNNSAFAVRDKRGDQGDPESLAFCNITPTALDEKTEPVQPTIRFTFFPIVLGSNSNEVQTLAYY